MKRQIEKILNRFFKPYEYDLEVIKRGVRYSLNIQADQRGREDWRYELACNYVDATTDPDAAPWDKQSWILNNVL